MNRHEPREGPHEPAAAEPHVPSPGEAGEPVGMAQDLARVSRLILVVVVLSALANLAGLCWFWVDRDRSIHVLRPAQSANDTLMRDLYAAQSGLRGYAATRDRALLALDEHPDARIRAQLDAIGHAPTGIPARLLTDQRRAVEAWLGYRRTVAGAVARGEDVSDDLARTPFPAVPPANAAVGSWLGTTVKHTSGRISVVVVSTGAGLVLGMLATVGILARMRRHVLRSVIQPLGELRHVVSAGTGRAPTDVGPAEIRTLADVVNDHLDATDRARETARLEHRLGKVKHDAALAVRRALDVPVVLEELRRALAVAFPGATVRVLTKDCDPAVFADATVAAERAGARVHVREDGPSRLASFVRDEDGNVALALVETPHPRTWHPTEVQLVEQLCDYASRGAAQARFDAERAQTITRLEALDRQKSDFMATVSHELRTPLTSIAGYLELLDDGDYGELTPGQAQVLGIVGRNTSRLRSLIEDLLVLSRIEANGVDLEVAPLDLSLAVDMVVENLSPQAATGRVAIVRTPGDVASAPIEGDAGQIERALTNIIGNAVKFTPEGGLVEVSLRATEGGYDVVVRDTGIGIPESDLADVGRRFFRASNVTAQTIPGTGLGLSIVRAIAEAHRGGLRIASEHGEGTTVTLSIGGGTPGT